MMPGGSCFHPLKSGRDGVCEEFCEDFCEVSIPSSRVGTTAKHREVFPNAGFHPLKSGRDPPTHRYAFVAASVSIPSSRVGTKLRAALDDMLNMFPSPQVGSGHTTREHKLLNQ